MKTPTESEVREAILAAALQGSPDGCTLRELKEIGRKAGLGRRRVEAAVRHLIGTGQVEIVDDLLRPDMGVGRVQRVLGYRFLGTPEP